MTILDYFSGTPRLEQAQILEDLERQWKPRTAYVISGPVGMGKSRVAAAIAAWVESWDKKATIVPPDGYLQSQYERGHPELASVRGSDEYYCLTYRQSCKTTKTKKKGNCKTCPHVAALAKAKTSGKRLMHTCTYMGTAAKGKRATALVGYPNVAIFDEAHKLIDFQQDSLGVKLWRHKHHWPLDLHDASEVVEWIDRTAKLPYAWERAKAKALLLSREENVLVERTLTTHYGRDEYLLRIVPLSARSAKPTLWPRSVDAIVLMSATIGPKDIEELGIDKYYDVVYLDCNSPIPASARPFSYMPLVDMSRRHMELSLPDMVYIIKYLLAKHQGEAGVIHATYGDALLLRPLLTDPRFLWHDKANKSQIVSSFIRGDAGRDRVLVASGLTEGADLAGDIAKWQVLTKVPFPSQESAFISLKSQIDPEWYDWQAVKAIVQAYGRVCRGPQDYGQTYMFDTKFAALYKRREYLFKQWFKDAIQW